MSTQPPILEYARPQANRRWVGYRPLRAIEVFFICWFGGIGIWVGGSLLFANANRPDTLAITLISGEFFVVALGAFLGVARERRRKQTLSCAAIALITGALAGQFQLDRCPHATYLQVFGISVPITGHACSNPRNAAPWWLRHR
jgi:hypothetical protein